MDLATVAVFGASGKIGRRVLRVLERRGLAIRALVHRTPVEAELAVLEHGIRFLVRPYEGYSVGLFLEHC